MQKPSTKKTNLSPAAAKALEQYRNAGKTVSNSENGPVGEEQSASQRSTAAPAASQMRRSGTRGK